MASIARRADRGNRWQARYRDASGKEHAKLFDRKVDAERWLNANKAAVDNGTWIDPAGAKRTVKEYGEKWRAAQVHRDTTRAQVETHLRRWVYPAFGDRQLGTIRKTEVQAWVTRLSDDLQPGTVRVVYSFLAAILKAAVEDRLIPASPCNGIKMPQVEPKRVVPMATEDVERLALEVPDRFRAFIILCAGTGLRQGEALGLTVDRVDFLRRTLTVDRQLVTVVGKAPYLGPPKTKASHRVIPLPQVVIDALAAHLAAYPSDGFVFTTDAGEPVRRTWFSQYVWRPSAKKMKLQEGVSSHDLRHYYASLLIRHGESVKTVQARLGHASAAETLDTYSHLWPDSDDRTREAVDAVLGNSSMAVAQ